MKHIITVTDRSGSMSSIADDMNGGFKSWLEETKKTAPKDTIFSAIMFDDTYDVVYERTPIDEVGPDPLMIIPRGSTALLDSMMKALSLVKDGESALIMVTTDGAENSSRETTLKALQDRVKELTANGVDFVYMSSDVNAFSDSTKYGATQSYTYNTAYDMSTKSNITRTNVTATYLGTPVSTTIDKTDPNKVISKDAVLKQTHDNIQTEYLTDKQSTVSAELEATKKRGLTAR